MRLLRAPRIGSLTWVGRRLAVIVANVQSLRPSLQLTLMAAFAVAAVATWASFFRTNPTTFALIADTEVVTGKIASLQSLHVTWHLEQASIIAAETLPFSGTLEIMSPASFRIERLSNGPLTISLQPADDGERVSVRLHSEGQPSNVYQQLDESLLLRIVDLQSLAASGNPITLPLLADELILGEEPAAQSFATQGILRSGTLSLLGTTLLGGRVYSARTIDLRLGDQVRVDSDSRTAHSRLKEGPFSGVVRIDDGPALRVAYQVHGSRVEIRSFFSDPRIEVVTWLDRISNDPLLVALWSLLGLGLATAGVVAGSASIGGSRTHG